MKWLLLSLFIGVGGASTGEALPQESTSEEDSKELSTTDIRVGHWIQAKGKYLGSGDFEAEKVEILEPDSSAALIGVVERVFPDRGRFWVNGQVVRVSEKTEWGVLSIYDIKGKQVKIKGRYHGPLNFSARSIVLREKGRASVEGRVDHIRESERGREATVLNVRVLLPPEVVVEAEQDPRSYELAPLKHVSASPDRLFEEDIEDAIPGSLRLTDTLRFGALLEMRSRVEENYNLDDTRPRSRVEHQPSIIAELRWTPAPKVSALLRGRSVYRYRTEERGFDTQKDEARLSEAWLNVVDILGTGVALQVGRQDFDDPREWLYDQNLDAVRAIWRGRGVRLELSASTTLAKGSEFDRHSNNYIAYLSNDSRKQHLGAYIIDRRDSREPRNYPIHFGVRALGDWIPRNDSWFEYSVVRGFTENANLEGWALDIGTTWSPRAIAPFYLTGGFAFSTGDDPNTPNVNEAYRQTGFQDNNSKLGGVSSLRYYGELVEPELSNLGIMTFGLGVRPTRNSSINVIYHDYRLSELTTRMRRTQLSAQPNGIGLGFGQEVDVVFALRRFAGIDLKVVAGYFKPGNAFTPNDAAFLASFRLRYRF